MKLFGRKKKQEPAIQFDPETQYAVIRSSICTGEKVAGFKNKTDGHFTEVMLISFAVALKGIAVAATLLRRHPLACG